MLSDIPLSREVLYHEIPFVVAIGICSHHFYFKHGEHHMQAAAIMYLHAFLFAVLTYGKCSVLGTHQGLLESTAVIGSYLTALFSSIVAYRKLFHRLRHFPGPPLASVSKLWHTSKTFTCKNHLILDDLHKKYGDFVRTGPTEVTVFKPEVKWAVDGPHNNCTKAVWYDILLPLVALNTNRSKSQHDQRRRAWDQAITMKTMSGYEERIQSHVLTLEKHVSEQIGETIDMTEWFYFLAFDVMGDFAFAKSFNMLEGKEWHYAVILLRRALGLLGPFSSVPWLAQIAFGLPIIPIIRDWNRMLAWCADRMAEQLSSTNERMNNISSHLINYSKKRNTLPEDARWLKGDSVALIVAGSDTVASTLINLFYRMALHPDHAQKIRDEIKTLDSIHDTQGLKELVHMDSCINEVLRMHPSVPTGGYRETPAEGLNIDGTYIPGNVTIVAPRYTMGRLESSYERPDDFVPERWYSRPEMVADRKTFTPFSIGRYSCVGRKLAMAEIRFTTALLLSKYDVKFAPHEDGTSVWRDMKDQFTAVPGKLDLVFTPIEG